LLLDPCTQVAELALLVCRELAQLVQYTFQLRHAGRLRFRLGTQSGFFAMRGLGLHHLGPRGVQLSGQRGELGSECRKAGLRPGQGFPGPSARDPGNDETCDSRDGRSTNS